MDRLSVKVFNCKQSTLESLDGDVVFFFFQDVWWSHVSLE